MVWWLWRGENTRFHSELGRENPQRRWYFILRCGRVGRCQALKTQCDFFYAGWSSLVARQAHNLKVVGSNPTPATSNVYYIKNINNSYMLDFLRHNNYSNLLLLIFFFLVTFFRANQVSNDYYLDILNKEKILGLEYKINNQILNHKLPDIKNKFYDDLIFSHSKNLLEHRTLDGFEGGEARHKLRWFYRNFEAKIYGFLIGILNNKYLTIYTLVQTCYIFGTFIFIFLTISNLKSEYLPKNLILSGLIFFSFFNFFLTNGIQTIYTIPEMFFLSIGIYLSLKKKFVLFLIPLFFSVVNRESGLALSLVYIIFNYKNISSYLMPIIASSIIILVNLDLASNLNFYSVDNYVPIRESFFSEDPRLKDIVFFGLFLFSNLIIFYYVYLTSNKFPHTSQFLFVTVLYILVALLGTDITNVYSLLLILPSLTVIMVAGTTKIKEN